MIETWPWPPLTVLLCRSARRALRRTAQRAAPGRLLGRLIALDRRCRGAGRAVSSPGVSFWSRSTIAVAARRGRRAGVGPRASALVAGACRWAPLALKVAFSLRGLIDAGRTVQRALETDTEAARAGCWRWSAAVRDLEPPQIASAAIESLAENLSDSVPSPRCCTSLCSACPVRWFYVPSTRWTRWSATTGATSTSASRPRASTTPPTGSPRASPAWCWWRWPAHGAEARPRGRRCAGSAAVRRAPTSSGTIAPWPAASTFSLEKPGAYC